MTEVRNLSQQITEEIVTLGHVNDQIKLLEDNEILGRYCNGVWAINSNEDILETIQDLKQKVTSIMNITGRHKKDWMKLIRVWSKNIDEMVRIANTSDFSTEVHLAYANINAFFHLIPLPREYYHKIRVKGDKTQGRGWNYAVTHVLPRQNMPTEWLEAWRDDIEGDISGLSKKLDDTISSVVENELSLFEKEMNDGGEWSALIELRKIVTQREEMIIFDYYEGQQYLFCNICVLKSIRDSGELPGGFRGLPGSKGHSTGDECPTGCGGRIISQGEALKIARDELLGERMTELYSLDNSDFSMVKRMKAVDRYIFLIGVYS